jgi:hypothetical protein
LEDISLIYFCQDIKNELNNRIKNINGIHFVTIMVDLDYFENGERKNWLNTARLNLNVEQQEYNPANSWEKVKR